MTCTAVGVGTNVLEGITERGLEEVVDLTLTGDPIDVEHIRASESLGIDALAGAAGGLAAVGTADYIAQSFDAILEDVYKAAIALTGEFVEEGFEFGFTGGFTYEYSDPYYYYYGGYGYGNYYDYYYGRP